MQDSEYERIEKTELIIKAKEKEARQSSARQNREIAQNSKKEIVEKDLQDNGERRSIYITFQRQGKGREGKPNLKNTVSDGWTTNAPQLSSNFKSKIPISTSRTIWRQSATSLSREDAPVFFLPSEKRFTGIGKDEKKNKVTLNLNIAGNISSLTRGSTFSKSKRVDHFVRRDQQIGPGPGTYKLTRFLEDQNISIPILTKSQQKHSSSKNLNSLLVQSENHGEVSNEFERASSHKKIQALTTVNNTSISRVSNLKNSWHSCNQRKTNQEPTTHHLNHANRVLRKPRPKEGRTIARCENPSKIFLHHGQKIPYQPELSSKNPGVGLYNITSPYVFPTTRKVSPTYFYPRKDARGWTMAIVLRRFNDKSNKVSPGPGTYDINAMEQAFRFREVKRAKMVIERRARQHEEKIFLKALGNREERNKSLS